MKQTLNTMPSEKNKRLAPRHVLVTVASTSSSAEKAESDSSFEHVAEVMFEDENDVWNSIELLKVYTAEGAVSLLVGF